jgi:phage terminase large subunit-like protein
VKAGAAIDPSFHGVVYMAPDDADWTDPTVWARTNPGLGVTIKREFLEDECRRAQEMAAYQNEFRRYHLNQWTESETAWISTKIWDEGQQPVDAAALRGRPCYGGLDMSTNTDLSAFVLVFPSDDESTIDVLAWAWCPREGIRKRSQKDRAPYERWVSAGVLEATEGDAVDQETIRARILELAATYDIRAVGFDDWNMGYLGPKLQAEGLNLIPIRQTFKALSGATKRLERYVLHRAIRHGGHPVLRWCLANTIVETDGPENLKPSKKKSTERIDLVVALILALTQLEQTPPSVYETRGVIVG